MDQKQASEQRFALLIDAENVSAKYIKPILSELSKYGTVTYKRIYGDWTQSLHARWKDTLLENSITPIQQFSYTSGKNSTDSAMIIDAMDILYTGDVEGFCLVSSDSDFTRLASRLRESGVTVIGMGERKTPKPFRTACDIFTTLEVINAHHRKVARSEDSAAPSAEEVEQAVVDIVTDNHNNGKATGLGEVGSRLIKVYPDFDVRSFGTGPLSQLLETFDRVTVIRDGNNINVELSEGEAASKAEAKAERDEKKPAEASEGGRRRRVRARKTLAPKVDEAVKAEAAAETPGPGAKVEKPAETSVVVDEKPAETADVADEKPAETPGTTTEASAETPDTVAETSTEAVAAPQSEDAAAAEEPAKRPGRRRGRRPKTVLNADDAVAEKAESGDEKEASASEPAAAAAEAAPKKTGRRGRPRKNAAAAVAEKADEGAAAAKTAAASDAPKRRGRKPRQTGTPADEATDPKIYIRELVKASGVEGVDLAVLNRQLRSRFRGFKIRDLGFTRINSYIEAQRGMTVETRGDAAFAVSTSALRAAKAADATH